MDERVFDVRKKPTTFGFAKEDSHQKPQHSSFVMYAVIAGLSFLAAVAVSALLAARSVSNPLEDQTVANSELQPNNQPVILPLGVEQNQKSPTPSTPKPQPTASASPSISPASNLTPDQIKIRILNSTSTTGLAAKLKQELTAKGYTIAKIGNAKNKYNKTQVWYQSGNQDKANQVAKDIQGYSLELDEADPNTLGESIDVLIIIGQE